MTSAPQLLIFQGIYLKHIPLDVITLELCEEGSHMTLSLLSKVLGPTHIYSHKQLSDTKPDKTILLHHTSESFSQGFTQERASIKVKGNSV